LNLPQQVDRLSAMLRRLIKLTSGNRLVHPLPFGERLTAWGVNYLPSLVSRNHHSNSAISWHFSSLPGWILELAPLKGLHDNFKQWTGLPALVTAN
jgi:hypothetical protein